MKTWIDFGINIPSNARGPEVFSQCPQCSPTRKKKNAKCLSVNLDKGCWFCNHCGWAGGLSTKITNEYRPKVYVKPTPKQSELPPIVVKYFADRGIPESVLLRNKIGYEKTFMPSEDAEVGAMTFPYYRGGELINIKYRSYKKSFKQVTGAEKIFYGLDDVSGAEVCLVEGEIDKLSLEAAGFQSCMSVPDGAPAANTKSYESKFDFIENCHSVLEGLKKIVIAVDSDPPGRKLEEELIRRLGPERCWRVVWPEGCKDANEVLKEHGAEVLADCISSARPVPVEGIFEVNDISVDIDDLYEHDMQGGVSTGWHNLTELYTVRPGEWTIVTGIPSHGKSSFQTALMVNIAKNHGWRFAIFSPENQPLQRHAAQIAALYSGKPFRNGPTVRMNPGELQRAKNWMQEHFVFILPPDDELSIDAILKKAKVAVSRYGIRGMVIDPWNELDHSRTSGMTETEYISQCLTKIRRFAREYHVHVWVIAHPTKLKKDLEGKYPIPTPYDIAGSAHFNNKADCAITVWRDVSSEGDLVEIHIQKVRFREVGRPGKVQLQYDIATGRYLDPDMAAIQAAEAELAEARGVIRGLI